MDRKTFPTQAQDLGARQILFVISDETPDRDEDILLAAGCDLTNFKKNPQFLGFHNYGDFPFGKVLSCWVDLIQKKVFSVVYFPTLEELATDPANASEHAKKIDLTYNLYRGGLLSAVSVGFDPKEMAPNPNSDSGYGKIIKKWELYEFSAVPVPANPNALIQGVKSGKITEAEKRALEDIMEKGALPFHAYSLADPDTAWDGPAEVAAASTDDLAKMCAWCDSANPDVKSSYKLPHHEHDGYKTVWKGVAAAMGVVLGSRGGVNIPESDMDAVKAHLAKHYKEFGKDVPGDKAAWEIQWKAEFGALTKSGRMFSAANKSKLDEIQGHHDTMKKAMDSMAKAHAQMCEAHDAAAEVMKDLLGQDEPDDDGNDDTDDDTDDDAKSVVLIVE